MNAAFTGAAYKSLSQKEHMRKLLDFYFFDFSDISISWFSRSTLWYSHYLVEIVYIFFFVKRLKKGVNKKNKKKSVKINSLQFVRNTHRSAL